MKKLASVFIAMSCSGGAIAADMTAVLPNARPGECYARVVIPAQYRTESSTVVVREASERLSIVPAEYKWEDQQVLVSEAAQRIEAVPATFTTVESELEVSPADSRWVSGSVHSNVSVNPRVLSLAEQAGVPVDSATSGQCFAEFFRAPLLYRTINGGKNVT